HGFNCDPGSKRYVRMKIAGEWIGGLPGNVKKVAILVNPSWDEAKAAAATPGITALQLHGAETPDFCRRLMEERIQFEKALPVMGANSVVNVTDFFTTAVLLDSGGAGEFGGSGRTLPWEIARDVVRANRQLRVILAGGLAP